METIENKSKLGNRIFYTILVLLILGSVGVTLNKIVIQKDYQIESETSCDPVAESCFHYEGVVCDGTDPECVPEEAYDYKLVSKNAATIYACEQTEEKLGCNEELTCTENEPKCSYTYCDLADLAEGEFCAEKALLKSASEQISTSTVSE